MRPEKEQAEDYRLSHASAGYGEVYKDTYQHGYYHDQWNMIEKPLLESVIEAQVADGRTSCLDFACGTGRITGVLEGTLSRVRGVDVSESMLEIARENCEKATFYNQDITVHPFNEKFDLVTAFRFFLNAEPTLRAQALASIEKCLHDNGRLIANIHVNSLSPLGLAYRLRNRLKRTVVAKTCSLEEMVELLDEGGFIAEEVIWYSYLPRIGWKIPWLSRALMTKVEAISNWLPVVPKRLAQSFMIIAKKKDARES